MDRLRAYKPKILVVGDLMIDHYLWGKCERISPEAPVQVVDIQKETTLLGGAGNVVRNLLDFGAQVDVLSVIGNDKNGDDLLALLKREGVSISFIIREEDRKTSKKSRLIASNQQILRFDKESKEDISQNSQKMLLKTFKNIFSDYDSILLSDYGKGVLGDNITKSIIDIAYNKIILIDPKGENYSKYKGATLITPNKKEASLATKIEIKDKSSLYKVGKILKESLDLDYAVITLSEEGMAIFGDGVLEIPTIAREVYDVTGAGDTVLASLGYALSCGFDIKDSAYFATSAAAVVVGKLGSATASIDEIERYERKLKSNTLEDKIKTLDELIEILKHIKDKNIVFTNGCFDILHAGHVKYLQKAKSFGEVLIVGLNSDVSVKRLKGDNRPINSFDDRSIVLSGLESVDYIVEFSEDTPYELIKSLQPDILVKGGDYKGKKVVGSDIVKDVRLVDFIDGKSTTKIIKKARL